MKIGKSSWDSNFKDLNYILVLKQCMSKLSIADLPEYFSVLYPGLVKNVPKSLSQFSAPDDLRKNLTDNLKLSFVPSETTNLHPLAVLSIVFVIFFNSMRLIQANERSSQSLLLKISRRAASHDEKSPVETTGPLSSFVVSDSAGVTRQISIVGKCQRRVCFSGFKMPFLVQVS